MELSAAAWCIVLGAGLATSALSGVIGMGGGMALVGVMAVVLPPAAVVPLHGVTQLASNFTRTLALLRHVHWRLFALYTPFLTVGTALAAWLWSSLSLAWFKPGIGVFLLAFLVYRRRKPELRNPPLWIYMPLGAVAGFLGVFVGATGPFIAPFFQRDDLEKESVIATKAAVQAVGHLLKLPAFFALGFDYLAHVPLLGALIASVVVGTLLGRLVLERLSRRAFNVLFEGTLALIALYLLLAPLIGS